MDLVINNLKGLICHKILKKQPTISTVSIQSLPFSSVPTDAVSFISDERVHVHKTRVERVSYSKLASCVHFYSHLASRSQRGYFVHLTLEAFALVSLTLGLVAFLVYQTLWGIWGI